jgi:hypothetical protein
LFDRLHDFLTTPDTLLVTVGFSYTDAHISARIDEALAENPSASVFAFQFRKLEDEGAVCDLGHRRSNLSIYAPDKALVNGIEGPWQIPAELPTKDWGPIRATYWGVPDAGSPPQFLLGAYEAFGRFFASSRSSQAQATPETELEVETLASTGSGDTA